jgi:hypothetical protein
MYTQLTLKLSYCLVVSWANQSIGALKNGSRFITIRIRIRIHRLAIKIATTEEL